MMLLCCRACQYQQSMQQKGELPIATVCQIVGADRARYYDWRQLGFVGRGASMLTHRDAYVLAVLTALSNSIGPAGTRQAFRQVGDQVRRVVPAGACDVVWDPAVRRATLVATEDELARAVRTGRPVQVVDLRDPVARALSGWRTEVEERASRATRA